MEELWFSEVFDLTFAPSTIFKKSYPIVAENLPTMEHTRKEAEVERIME